MLPSDARLKLRINLGSWPLPPIFSLLARGGDVAGAEMLRTFNMGIGMVICVPADRAAEAETLLQRADEQVFTIGEVVPADAPDAPVEFMGEVPA
jgi:phosphoribosylformylglycinamidine cyclo-ligase